MISVNREGLLNAGQILIIPPEIIKNINFLTENELIELLLLVIQISRDW